MALKKLNRFQYMDLECFFDGKRFRVVGKQPWIDYKTKERIGTKIEVVIFVDKTDYGCEEGEFVSNIYEKLVFKVPKEVDVPMDAEIRATNPEGTVYGEFRNLLSIVCDDIEIVGK